jgi:lactate dehydrogenase-like 2-hydroxyacid dehydrogenase
MMATARNIPMLHNGVLNGQWLELRNPIRLVREKRLGILGLGKIGMVIAEMVSGFKMPISYHNRRQRDDVPYAYRSSAVELAANVDILITMCPLDETTHHIVNRDVLKALGPTGYLINMARGAVIDTPALIDALNKGIIAGAGLDVVEGEPVPPPALLKCPNLVITPHVGGESVEAGAAIHDLLIGNLAAHFAGKPLLTPIPA